MAAAIGRETPLAYPARLGRRGAEDHRTKAGEEGRARGRAAVRFEGRIGRGRFWAASSPCWRSAGSTRPHVERPARGVMPAASSWLRGRADPRLAGALDPGRDHHQALPRPRQNGLLVDAPVLAGGRPRLAGDRLRPVAGHQRSSCQGVGPLGAPNRALRPQENGIAHLAIGVRAVSRASRRPHWDRGSASIRPRSPELRAASSAL